MIDIQRSIRVVLLEDDDLDAELVVAKLAESGLIAEVRRALSESEYLSALDDAATDLILSDFSLPGYDGLAALEAAREKLPEVPFIFVSGAIGEERAIDTLQRGATDYVLKSRLERLIPATERALRLAEERRRRRAAESERDRLLESERRAREAAEAANRMKDEFLAVVSHELRTPLNAVMGWANLLTPEANAELVGRGLQVIKRNAQAQARLIEDILDISRIVTGKLQIRPEQCSLGSFIHPALESVRPAAEAKHINLVAELDGDVVVNGDSARLQQVIWNLLSNGVKFTPPGGNIRIRTGRDGDDTLIVVEDSGQGIDGDFLPHVFERFRQADPSATRRAGGPGLGLSIVRYLTEAHGGCVTAESAGTGQGARFVVRLPCRVPEPQPALPAVQESGVDHDSPESAGPVSLRGVHVLLVEDDTDSRELIALILRRGGAEVSSTSSAVDALKLLEVCRPSVVISDIGMPNMDGYSFIERVRRLPVAAGGATPAIALTAYTRELDRRQAATAGFQRHLAKPVAAGLLLRSVCELASFSDAPARAVRE
ncbi:MAG: response regulator [Myxococcales bacterium]